MSAANRIVLAGALALMAWAAPARAQSGLELEISPFAGVQLFLDDGPTTYTLERTGAEPTVVEDARFDDSWTAGVNVGLRLNEYFAVDALLAWVPTWLTGTNLVEGTDVYAYMYGLSGVMHLPLRGPVHPYWGIGFGAESYDYSGAIHSRTQWMTTFVAGMALDLGEGRSLRIQGRDLLGPFDPGRPGGRGGWENDVMITAGMSWQVPLYRRKPASPGTRRGRGPFDPR